MSERIQVFLIVAPMVLALAFGLWVGLGYPGLYDRDESTTRRRRRSPSEMFADWVVGILDGRGNKETD
jgi:hypothetical protein